MHMTRKNILLILVFVLCLSIFVVFILHRTSGRSITINFKYTKEVVVYDGSLRETGGKDRLITKLQRSGETVRVPKDAYIVITYSAEKGYADGFVAGADEIVTISPNFSDEKLATIRDEALPIINSQLADEYPNLSTQYNIAPGKILENGVWYVGLLTYKGSDASNSDTLKYFFKKEGPNWKLVGRPNIVFTTYNTPTVSSSVLTTINNIIVE